MDPLLSLRPRRERQHWTVAVVGTTAWDRYGSSDWLACSSAGPLPSFGGQRWPEITQSRCHRAALGSPAPPTRSFANPN